MNNSRMPQYVTYMYNSKDEKVSQNLGQDPNCMLEKEFPFRSSFYYS